MLHQQDWICHIRYLPASVSWFRGVLMDVCVCVCGQERQWERERERAHLSLHLRIYKSVLPVSCFKISRPAFTFLHPSLQMSCVYCALLQISSHSRWLNFILIKNSVSSLPLLIESNLIWSHYFFPRVFVSAVVAISHCKLSSLLFVSAAFLSSMRVYFTVLLIT